MIENLHQNTGKTLQQWMDLVQKENLPKYGEIVKFLKEQHALTHGFANLVALKAKGSDVGSVPNQADLIRQQYQGKEHFKLLYEKLVTEIQKLESDIEIAPKRLMCVSDGKSSLPPYNPLSKLALKPALT
ncbi:DUF4287 domain-containing protein [Adhaeribacter arboris]|uniref:DUF4287 domain-containing protein n=1 Tax=Adhaeribacter arboris TaxID=2072846 RepID=UPI001E617498|nr:DUF4287 domain-containing protein [Adhaeribacter arboris]